MGFRREIFASDTSNDIPRRKRRHRAASFERCAPDMRKNHATRLLHERMVTPDLRLALHDVEARSPESIFSKRLRECVAGRRRLHQAGRAALVRQRHSKTLRAIRTALWIAPAEPLCVSLGVPLRLGRCHWLVHARTTFRVSLHRWKRRRVRK